MAKPEPGRDPQMAERTQKLNVLFAASSLLLLLTLSLMVWADYALCFPIADLYENRI